MTEELASGDNLVFAATGVTTGDLLQGVRYFGGGARTHSVIMAYQSKQIRFIDRLNERLDIGAGKILHGYLPSQADAWKTCLFQFDQNARICSSSS